VSKKGGPIFAAAEQNAENTATSKSIGADSQSTQLTISLTSS
jgi:hypothetical protein